MMPSPFYTTQIRGNMANLGALDAKLAANMEDIYVNWAGNRWSYCAPSASVAPTWSAGSSAFVFPGLSQEFSLPWEQQVGFDHIHAAVYLMVYQPDVARPSLRMTTKTWIAAHTTQSGPYAQGRELPNRENMPVEYHTGVPQAFWPYLVNCDVDFPSGYAADRRMLITFGLEVDMTCFIVGVHLQDKAPPRVT